MKSKATSKSKFPPKREINRVRASLIKKEIKSQYKKLKKFRDAHFPDVTEAAFRGWFFPPIHLKDENLIKMESILSIQRDTIMQELADNGITEDDLFARDITI